MAKIICITSGLKGILHASFELVNRLQKVGHEVSCASPQEVGDYVSMQGFKYMQLAPVNHFPAPAIPTYTGMFKRFRRLGHKLWNMRHRQVTAVSNLGMDVFRDFLKKEKADLLIIDVELHEHIMTAVVSEQPILLLSQWFSLWNRKGLPPITTTMMPGKGQEGGEGNIASAWKEIQSSRHKMFQKKRMLSLGTDRRSTLINYAKQIGFSLDFIKENYWPGPFVYDKFPVISMTAEALEFPHDIRPNSFYVGPMVSANRVERIDNALLLKLQSILKEKEEKNKALIYASVSSYKKGDTDFLKKLIQAVGTRTDWMMIIGLGGKLQSDFTENIPANVFTFSWVPQLKVLEQADCSINHGGIHTINECIHFQVPMLVYSGNKSDQNGCAARVAYHEIGIMADKDTDSIEAIRNNIINILGETKYTDKIKKVHQLYEANRSEKRLEKIVDQFLETPILSAC